MKITFKLDNGTEITTTPDQVTLANVDPRTAVLSYRVNPENVVPVFQFPGQFFALDILKKRDAELINIGIKQAEAKAAEAAKAATPAAPAAPADASPTAPPAVAPADATAQPSA